jgi:hypothetical protein
LKENALAIARIYQPAKNAMQSGRAKTKNWVMEFEPGCAKRPDLLMGWTGSTDMKGDEIRLRFPGREEAVAFAERCGIEYRVQEPEMRAIHPKAYADNFSPDRIEGNWTH